MTTIASRNSQKVKSNRIVVKGTYLSPLLPVVELPENSPRYVVLSYELKHEDGRTSFPLVLINWCPSSSEPNIRTLHASALIDFQNAVSERKFAQEYSFTHTIIHSGRYSQGNRDTRWPRVPHPGSNRFRTACKACHIT